MSVDEAVEFFSIHPKVHHALELMRAVGLGYLTLCQTSPTLSGGEAQRLKLVTELAKARPDLRRQREPHTLCFSRLDLYSRRLPASRRSRQARAMTALEKGGSGGD